MKAVIISSYGGLDNLVLETIADPVARNGSVVIDVKDCSVNFADSLMVEGTYQVKPPLPFSPGLEVSGIINKVGKGVSGWSEGDKVIGLTNWGGFAEKVIVPANQLWALPTDMSYEEAAAFIIAYGSSHVPGNLTRIFFEWYFFFAGRYSSAFFHFWMSGVIYLRT